MDDEINDDFPIVDRSALLLEPTAQFLAWLKSNPGDRFEMTLEDIQEEYSVYLLPAIRDQEEWLHKNYKPLFEQELFNWCMDDEFWPQELSFKTFREFFRPRFHTLVYDLGKGPICVGYE
jgi:hypothetical protein